jgi:hypothetical protein
MHRVTFVTPNRSDAMDQLIKELIELKTVIQDAREDGRIGPLEAVRIVKEMSDILQMVADVIFRIADAEEKNQQ